MVMSGDGGVKVLRDDELVHALWEAVITADGRSRMTAALPTTTTHAHTLHTLTHNARERERRSERIPRKQLQGGGGGERERESCC